MGNSPKSEVCEHLRPLEKYILSTGAQETFRGKAWSNDCRTWVYFNIILNTDALRKKLALDNCVKLHEHIGTHSGTEMGLYCEIHKDGIMGAHPNFPYGEREVR